MAAEVDKVYRAREQAYSDIAAHMTRARVIRIVSGSLHSFWSTYRELLIEVADSGWDIQILLLNPESSHAAVRAGMDAGSPHGTEIFPGYAATIYQICSELKGCRCFDLCPPV